MIGHLLYHNSLTKRVIEGDIGRGSLRIEYMKQIMIDMGKTSYKQLNKLSNDRESWRFAVNQSND